MGRMNAWAGLGLLLLTGGQAEAAIESVGIAEPIVEAGVSVDVSVSGILNDGGWSIHTGDVRVSATDVWVDVVLYRDPHVLATQAIRPFDFVVQIPGLLSGAYTVTLREHTLRASQFGEIDVLFTDPLAYEGPTGDPFGSYGYLDHTQSISVIEARDVPEPASLGGLALLSLAGLRRRPDRRGRTGA